MFDSIGEIVLASLNKTRPKTPVEAFETYQKLCKRNRVLPLWGQFETSVKRLHKEGLIKCKDGKAVKV